MGLRGASSGPSARWSLAEGCRRVGFALTLYFRGKELMIITREINNTKMKDEDKDMKMAAVSLTWREAVGVCHPAVGQVMVSVGGIRGLTGSL